MAHSLSNWMLEIPHIRWAPPGRDARTYFNLWLVLLVSGFGHGAAWNFEAWGAFHGFFLCLDKAFKGTRIARAPAWVGLPVTFVLVLFSWVLFRAETLAHAVAYAGRMVDLFGAAPEAAAPNEFGRRHARRWSRRSCCASGRR